MSAVAICGGPDLREVAAELGLREDETKSSLVLVDADDDAAVAGASHLDPRIPRVFVAEAGRAALLAAAGVLHVVVRPLSAQALGAVVFAIERERERPPRLLLFVSATGATGRTSLVANLALRLALHVAVVALDATGTGALAWRLGATVAPWPALVAVGADLGEAHLRLAGAQRDGILVLGGSGACGEEQLLRVIELARAMGLLLVDGPAPWCAGQLPDRADRVFVCANPDPASVAVTLGTCGELFARGAQLVVSQARERDATELAAAFGRAPALLLPRDEAAMRDALLRRGAAGGELGRTYDAIAEIILAEVTA